MQTQPKVKGHESVDGRISRYQIKMLHVLKSKLKLTDDEYRERVQEMHGFSGTSKDLTYDEAEALISLWKAEAIEKGVWKSYRGLRSGNANNKLKYDDLGIRLGMASPKQLRMIEGMWADVSRTHKEDHRQRALRKFVFRIAKTEDLRFLTGLQARKVIKAIEQMKVSKRSGGERGQ